MPLGGARIHDLGRVHGARKRRSSTANPPSERVAFTGIDDPTMDVVG
jgi:hypothetical protein